MPATEKKSMNQQLTGNIGLYYCCYKLSRLGWNVMPTARNARGVDIIAYNQDASHFLGIQVKTLSKRNPVPLGSSLEKIMGDYWIIVSHVTSPEPHTFVLKPAEVRDLANPFGKDEKLAYWLETKAYIKEEFQDAWERIGHGGI